jgi:flagellar basal-body rod protein FlgF
MSIGIYQNAASLSALERWQDAVAQNITSAQVTGFKRRVVQMDGRQAGEILVDPKSRLDRGEGRPAIFPEVRYGVAFTNGEAQPTRRELDFALVGDGFFTVRMPDGSTGYTRAGQLQIRSDRTLINSAGLELLNSTGEPLQLAPQGGALASDMTGELRQGEVVVGRIGVVRFADPSVLVPTAGGIFLARGGTEPEAVDRPTVLQGHLEAANVKPLNEMVDLVNIARAYEANQKLIQSRDHLLQRVLDAVG